jgi:serine/threonine protein phosphatase 1
MPRTIPRLPEGVRIYAIGDVHGRADLLRETFDIIDADLRHFPALTASIVLVGDYIDRGPDSRGVLEFLVQRAQSQRLICLRGNHEVMLLDAMRNCRTAGVWLRSGGRETLASYGIELAGDINEAHWETVMREVRRSMPAQHAHFLQRLPSVFTCGDFLFVHAGLKPGVAIEAQRMKDLFWIRDEFLDSDWDFGKYVVHGHTPVAYPDIRSNRINIDTGAYTTGNLTLIAIENDSIMILTQYNYH